MVISKDILLRGSIWEKVIKEYSLFFSEQTNYDIFILCMSIGIRLDKRYKNDDKADVKFTVPRNVMSNHDKGKFDYFLKTAILTTNTELLDERERLKIAFGDDDKVEFNKINFLHEFANYGAKELYENIGDTELETMMNLNEYLMSLGNKPIEVLRTDHMDDDLDLAFYE